MKSRAGLCVVFWLLAVLLWAAPASADSTTPRFNKMEGKIIKGQLVLVYEIEGKSWRKLESMKIMPPTLNLYRAHRGKSKFLHSQKLNQRKGSLTFPRKVGVVEGSQLKIGVHGSSGGNKIGGWRYQWQDAKLLSFRIRNAVMVAPLDPEPASEPQSQPQSQPTSQPTKPQAHPEWRTHVVQACDKHAYVSSQKGECVGHAVKVDPRWAAQTVKACAQNGYVKSQTNECIEVAGEHKRFNPAETARLCKANGYVSSQFLNCMRLTARYKGDPKELLPACAAAVYVKSQRQECFERAATLPTSSASLLRACKGSDWKQCIDNAMK